VSDIKPMMTESELREKWIMCCNSLRLQTECVESLTAKNEALVEALTEAADIIDGLDFCMDQPCHQKETKEFKALANNRGKE